MAVLDNPRHERFAQELAKGRSATEAYSAAGFKHDPHGSAAARLYGNVRVQARVQELLEAGAKRAEITVGKVLTELAKIGFSDIRKVVLWSGAEVADEIDGDDGDGGLPKIIVRSANLVRLLGSEEIDDETAACISEISQTKEGSLKVKLHDKRAALVDIGRHLNMFVERKHISLDGELKNIPDRQLAELFTAGLEEGDGEEGGTSLPN